MLTIIRRIAAIKLSQQFFMYTSVCNCKCSVRVCTQSYSAVGYLLWGICMPVYAHSHFPSLTHTHTQSNMHTYVFYVWHVFLCVCIFYCGIIVLTANSLMQFYSYLQWAAFSNFSHTCKRNLLVALSENPIPCLTGKGCKYSKNANFTQHF